MASSSTPQEPPAIRDVEPPAALNASPGQDGSRLLSIRCFGSFAFSIDGRAVDLTSVRPRARALLRLLALHKGRAVHREILCSSLWPEADAAAGLRNLQVAVSALRRSTAAGRTVRLLVDDHARGRGIPAGDPSGLDAPSIEFDHLMSSARSGTEQPDLDSVKASLERALELQTNELLLEDGPAEWVVGERDHYRAAGVEAARTLASLFEENSPARAIAFCREG